MQQFYINISKTLCSGKCTIRVEAEECRNFENSAPIFVHLSNFKKNCDLPRSYPEIMKYRTVNFCPELDFRSITESFAIAHYCTTAQEMFYKECKIICISYWCTNTHTQNLNTHISQSYNHPAIRIHFNSPSRNYLIKSVLPVQLTLYETQATYNFSSEASTNKCLSFPFCISCAHTLNGN